MHVRWRFLVGIYVLDLMVLRYFCGYLCHKLDGSKMEISSCGVVFAPRCEILFLTT